MKISPKLAVRIVRVEDIEGLHYTTRSARKVWLAPISDKTEVELRRFEFPYSDPTSNAACRVILGCADVGSVLDIAHMIFQTGGFTCRELR